MSDLSPLEEHFPRLVHEIVACWGSPASFDQLQGLLVDSRGGRQGFPADVYSDLSLLLTLVPRPKGPYDIWSEAADADKNV
ncbi:MAG: hypothetical protein HZY77_15990 [Thiobacillus sp.]|uniref:hypothetical protein n=1 Tax=Thiobacillus sp. TaxID=924 RepID=UPI00168C3F16|nr:hypothetical protein [Thiobacillus sp.]QLQ04047.1 MAG: hypothetical protein HZY77_15990 [Thiobacillus sp.]